MKTKLLVSLPFLAALALPAAVEEEIAFRPSSGTRVKLTIGRVAELYLEEANVSILVDGEEQDTPAGDIEGSLGLESEIVIIDEYVESDGGRPRKLRRTYESLSDSETIDLEGPSGEMDESTDRESRLEGATVVFTWDEDDEEYVAGFEDDDGDEELLEDLACRIDLASFLPSRPVSPGDTWDVDVAAFEDILDPGGDLHFESDEERSDEEQEARDEMEEQMEDNLDGEITAELVEIVEEGGNRVAVIALRVEIETYGSVGPIENSANGATIMTTQELEVSLDLEGELLWNLDAGHLAGLELGGEFRYVTTNLQTMSGEGEIEFELNQVFEGDTTFTIEVEAESRE